MKWLEIIVGIRMEALGGMSALLSMMSHSGYDNCALEDCIWTPTPQYCACQ